jgi:hypothetical protein
MGNDLTGNPMYVDTAAALWTASHPKYVRLIQWIDDAADIADDDDIALIINGITFTGKIQLTANAVENLCVWQLGPFSPGIPIQSFTVTTIDHGILYIWFD